MYSLIPQLINSSIHELASSQIYEKRLSTRYCDREQQRRRWKDNVRAEHRRWTRYERTEGTHHRFRPSGKRQSCSPRARGPESSSNSNFGSQDVSSLGLGLRARLDSSMDSSLSPLIMKSSR